MFPAFVIPAESAGKLQLLLLSLDNSIVFTKVSVVGTVNVNLSASAGKVRTACPFCLTLVEISAGLAYFTVLVTIRLSEESPKALTATLLAAAAFSTFKSGNPFLISKPSGTFQPVPVFVRATFVSSLLPAGL